jgi:hypothetical protein
MAFQTPPQRHWRNYGNDPLPSGAKALNEPFAAFPSWFMRISCDRCGNAVMHNEAHFTRGYLPLHIILDRKRRDGCGGRAARAKLLRSGRRHRARRHAGLRGSLPSMR